MTCIAYRDGVMAADGQMEYDRVKMPCVKIAKRRGHLFGAAGAECPPLAELIDAFFDLDEETRQIMKGYEFNMLVVTPQGEIQVWDENMSFEPVLQPFHAIGTGDVGALCAMEVGATAVQAVKAACKWVPGIGGPIAKRKL